jgi:predicted O-methyltransferase YrrM
MTMKKEIEMIIKRVKKKIKKIISVLRKDYFSNPGPISEGDYLEILSSIDEIKPKIFVEIGTGKGISAEKIFNYLISKSSLCKFFTIDIYKKNCDMANSKFRNFSQFRALHGLSVSREETTSPAFDELKNYSGPQDILRNLIKTLNKELIDIAFIDSRKGSALAEFLVLEKYLSQNGVIYCHDILNNGKGVEVLEYLNKNKNKYSFRVLDTGKEGLIKIKLK